MAAAFLLADLAAFFDPDEFADAAVFDGDTATVYGIFDNAYSQGDVGPAGVASSQPAFTLRTADVPARVCGRYLRFGNLLAGGSRYQVMEDQPNGSGISTLMLELA